MPIREISIALLESKLAKYFNDRETPLFKVRLHGTDFGQSDLTVFFDQEGMGYQEIFSMDMGHLEFNLPLAPDPDFYFNNLETERISTSIFFADRVGIEARIDFETENEEIKVNNFPNIDFTEFNITVRFLVDSRDGAIDLLTWIDEMENVDQATDFVITRVLVTAPGLDDDVVRKRARRSINAKVFEALKTSPIRDFLKLKATPWLMGNTFHVNNVDSNGASLLIDYVLPPGQPEPPPFS